MQEQRLKDQMQEYSDLEKNMKNKLEYLHNDIAKIKKEANSEIESLNKELEEAKKKEVELGEANKKISDLEEQNKILQQEKEERETKIKECNKNNAEMMSHFQIELNKVLKQYEPITSNLS